MTAVVWTSFSVPLRTSTTAIDGASPGVPVREDVATSGSMSPRCAREPSSRKDTVHVPPPTLSSGVRSTWTRAMDGSSSSSPLTVAASASCGMGFVSSPPGEIVDERIELG